MAQVTLQTGEQGLMTESVDIKIVGFEHSGWVTVEFASRTGQKMLGGHIQSRLKRLDVTFNQDEARRYLKIGYYEMRQKWISVKERLPEYGESVLVYLKGTSWANGRLEFCRRTHTSAQGEHWSIDYGHYITHWMPLPEPPREYVDMQVTPLSVPYASCKGPDGEGPGSGE